MFRQALTLLLLLNYLLVVCASVAERPARPVDRAFPYVHSHDCQLRHTLQIGCFDDCNGVQYTVQKPGEKAPLHQLLSNIKGLDLHCLPEVAAVQVQALVRPARPLLTAASASALRSGYHSQLEAPPRQG